MDRHDQDHGLLGAFLAGDLDPVEALRFDEHLLECERCWRAVREDRAGREAARLLRQPARAGLTDQVAFAVQVAAAVRTAGRRRAGPGDRSSRRARPGGRARWQQRAGAGALGLGLAITLLVFLLAGGPGIRSLPPAAVMAVARYAQAVPSQEHFRGGTMGVPVVVGRPVTVTVRGQRIEMRTWRLGSAEAVVAVSGQPFPMPAGAEAASGMGMAWSARLGKLTLYCLNGPTSELLAAPVPAAELAELAAAAAPGLTQASAGGTPDDARRSPMSPADSPKWSRRRTRPQSNPQGWRLPSQECLMCALKQRLRAHERVSHARTEKETPMGSRTQPAQGLFRLWPGSIRGCGAPLLSAACSAGRGCSSPERAQSSRPWRPRRRCCPISARRSPAGSRWGSTGTTGSPFLRGSVPRLLDREFRSVHARVRNALPGSCWWQRPALLYPLGFLDPFCEAVVQGVEEAVANALVANEEMVGRGGHRSPALPRDRVTELAGTGRAEHQA